MRFHGQAALVGEGGFVEPAHLKQEIALVRVPPSHAWIQSQRPSYQPQSKESLAALTL